MQTPRRAKEPSKYVWEVQEFQVLRGELSNSCLSTPLVMLNKTATPLLKEKDKQGWGRNEVEPRKWVGALFLRSVCCQSWCTASKEVSPSALLNSCTSYLLWVFFSCSRASPNWFSWMDWIMVVHCLSTQVASLSSELHCICCSLFAFTLSVYVGSRSCWYQQQASFYLQPESWWVKSYGSCRVMQCERSHVHNFKTNQPTNQHKKKLKGYAKKSWKLIMNRQKELQTSTAKKQKN